MKTNEQIAQEMVKVQCRDRMANGGEQDHVYGIRVGAIEIKAFLVESIARGEAESLIGQVLPLLQEAREAGMQDALSLDVAGDPLSDEALESARLAWKKVQDDVRVQNDRGWSIRMSREYVFASVNDLFAHIDFLTRLLRDSREDGSLDQYQHGFEKGREKGINDGLNFGTTMERKRCAEVAWKMQQEQFGGGTAIGNAIMEQPT
jgi:hypothetical protein